MRQDLDPLYNKLGYRFQNQTLLQEALTHRSMSAVNNERLEFLGDSIINFSIAKTIYRRFPLAREGQLSRLRANLVRGETLAQIAKEISLGEYLILGPGELKSGGDQRTSTLADTVEAIIAAVYLDGGIEASESVIMHLFSQRLSKVSYSRDLKDAKTQLQEYLQARRHPLPTYRIAETEGDAHNQIFHIECTVDGFDYRVRGKGSNRRRAEQAAATQYLSWLKSNKLDKKDEQYG
ncbi:MAG: ribonuclease III [Gammaproteobacteria bacterium]